MTQSGTDEGDSGLCCWRSALLAGRRADPADEPVAVSPSIRASSCGRSGCACCKRERERTSHALAAVRALIAGNAPMPERGFA